MNGKEIIQLKYFKLVSITVGVLIVALSGFAAGIAVGIHKAKFSYAWGENYERNFVGNRGGVMGDNRGEKIGNGQGSMMERSGFDGRDFRNAHGVAGKVLSVSDTSLIISDRSNKENTVTVTEKTILKRNGEDVKLSDIAKDDTVVVIGAPGENGVVNADFIRVFKQGNTNQ